MTMSCKQSGHPIVRSNELHCHEMFRCNCWLAKEQGWLLRSPQDLVYSVPDAVERNCGSEVSQYLRNLDRSPKFIGHQHSNKTVAVHVRAYTLYIHHPHACLYSWKIHYCMYF